ncbi:MAG: hypothetical protein MJ054_02465, partial [Clostridia bacterium]|nr:hypothetical protein [Clostridia bacterium]
GDFTWQVVRTLVLQLWIMVGMHGLFFGISMAIGKTGGSVALNIVGVDLVFGILETILSIFKLKFDFNFSIVDYNLENVLLAVMASDMSLKILLRSILLPLVYVVGFVGLGYWVNYRRDV